MTRSSRPSPLTSPGPGDGETTVSVKTDPVEAKAVGAVECRKVEAGTEARGPAEHDVALAISGVSRVWEWVSAWSADDEIAETIAVDVSGPGYGIAAEVVRIDAVEPKAVSAVESREVEGCIEP
jgi:hypothetical protein